MQIGSGGDLHLTYCTNIHPGETWEDTFASVREYGPALKARLSPAAPFGLGLRLSDRASVELLQGDRLDRFRSFLRDQGLYVAILNGFPFGAFHGSVVKSEVFAPDWREEARVNYTLRLLEILARLLPERVDGGISTLPLSYKRWSEITQDDRELMTRNIARVAAAMARVREETGKLIHLDIEPEPDGLIENTRETVAFFEHHLLRTGTVLVAETLACSGDTARSAIRNHVQLCYDTCHFAVEYEEPEEALEQFRAAGIGIGRVQVSSALRVPLREAAGRGRLAEQLRRFVEPTYLHQVIERRAGGEIRRYADLIEALPHIHDPEAREWRIHFHVPLFVSEYGDFDSTQDDIRAAFRHLASRPLTRHLEIETYTWDVLPPALKQDLLESIHREFAWVLEHFGEAPAPPRPVAIAAV